MIATLSAVGVAPEEVKAQCRDGNCSSDRGRVIHPRTTLFSEGAQEGRQNSHNFGDNNTAVLGDVNIRVGHERVEISGFGGGSNGNYIDTSVHSNIILGNMKQ